RHRRGWRRNHRPARTRKPERAMSAFLTVADLAERLNVSESTVYDLVSIKKIACHRIGKRRGPIRFTEEQGSEYLPATLREAEGGHVAAPARRAALPSLDLD